MKRRNIWKLLGYYISGNRLPDDDCIESWKSTDPGNEKIINDLNCYRRMLDFDVQDEIANKAWDALHKQMNSSPEKIINIKPNNKPVIRQFPIYRLVASITILILLGGSILWFLNDNEEVQIVEKYNPSGLKTRIDLPDGTIVWLNANSTIKYPKTFEGLSKREVYLTGEAYFDVVHHEKLPFVVNTSNFHIEVLGTIFNVKSYPEDEDQVATLVKGSIKLKTIGITESTNSEILLTPNQQVTYSKKDGKVTLDLVESAAVTSWVDGKYRFKNESFESISEKLEQEYRTKFYFSSPALKKLYFTGTISRNDDLHTILKIFQAGIPIDFEMKGDSILVKHQ
jgi:ferric-dicitrate binding protein FerR (iron transport regulator)